MIRVSDYPLLLFVFSFFVLSLSAWLGRYFSEKRRSPGAEMGSSFGVIEAATLTLLGLIIGFTFSMALGRYDQRKN